MHWVSSCCFSNILLLAELARTLSTSLWHINHYLLFSCKVAKKLWPVSMLPCASLKTMASKKHENALFPVVMAGGSGTRFWPLSRRAFPKQFLPLASGKALLTETLERLGSMALWQQCHVVCGKTHLSIARKLLPKVPGKNWIAEPQARNTAPAIALAVAHVSKKNPEAIVAVFPADHHVANPKALRSHLLDAMALAKQGHIVTLGIVPSGPETGFGYIRRGEVLGEGGHRVQAFVEKPDEETAKAYLASGDYFWNAGIFVFRADAMVEAFGKHMPEVAQALLRIREAIGKTGAEAVLQREFKKMTATSIDFGVAEKADNMAVVPADMGWHDVGSFQALEELKPKDSEGNILCAQTLLEECKGNIFWSKERLIAALGVEGLVVIDTKDVLLVLDKRKCQNVRTLVERLQQDKKLAKHL
jgi:mannose-1-phosphate guanylyltransferase